MKNNWKESFEQLFEENTWIDKDNVIDGLKCKRETRHVFIAFIESLLAEQKKELMLEIMEQEVKCLQEIYNNRDWNELVDQYNLTP